MLTMMNIVDDDAAVKKTKKLYKLLNKNKDWTEMIYNNIKDELISLYSDSKLTHNSIIVQGNDCKELSQVIHRVVSAKIADFIKANEIKFKQNDNPFIADMLEYYLFEISVLTDGTPYCSIEIRRKK